MKISLLLAKHNLALSSIFNRQFYSSSKHPKIINQLPNNWNLVTSFLKENINLKYCMSYKNFIVYKNNMWSTINHDQLTRLFFTFLKINYPKQYKQFNFKNLDIIYLLISQNEEFSLPDAITEAKSNGFLLPFINGVLNAKTFHFNLHSPNNNNTHIIPVNYSHNDSIINTPFQYFLGSIVNHNSVRLQVLRGCLHLIITNYLLYHIALYIYGPGGTGNSVFTNI